jgi:ubiquinone/menaquinone biosynthesis C-methylase UbiE
MEKDIRGSVESFYAGAAAKPQKTLCCPTSYNEEDVSHIPKEALDISYGCGSPVGLADIKEGETVLDLGSGGGIDCFIAAKKVGRGGRVTGVDMTDGMIGKAREASVKVADNLGYANVEFKKGFLEDIPVEAGVMDIVTSNCVLNLSPDKGKVMKEIHRALKDRGRFCIADIVSEKEVPPSMRSDKRLWGECISGSITEEEFLKLCREAGFYGLRVTSSYLYRVVEGIRFYSITLMGYKLTKGPECVYRGHYAVYNGPFSSVHDDDGHEFPSGVPVEICTDTLEKLTAPPYRGLFTIIDTEGEVEAVPCGPQNITKGSGDGSSCC